MSQKILIVDDEPEIRRLMKRVVMRMGLEALEAADGDEALDLARRERPALVLLDMHMPRLDGVAVLRELLAIDRGMAVIMVTGDVNEDRAKWLLKNGARDYVTKPVDINYIETVLLAHLAVGR